METTQFKSLLKSLDSLNTQQDRILRQQLSDKAMQKQVSHTLETPFNELVCPHCQGKDLYRWGKRSDMQRYRCKSCKKTFNCLTGTPLARLRRKGHWLDYANCLKEGFSIRKAAQKCNITPNTAFRWRHRFLQNSVNIKAERLEGIVEAQDSLFRISNKGSRKLNRPARKRGNEARRKGHKLKYVSVFVGRDRNRNIFDSIFEPLSSKSLSQTFKSHISSDALFCSNNKSVYHKFVRQNHLRHGTLQLSKGEVVKKDIVHLRNVMHYQTNLKEWILYHFRGVATKYLPNYLAWMRALDEFNYTISSKTILLRARSGGHYKFQPITTTQLY